MCVVYQRKNIEEENDETGHLGDRGSRMTAVLLRRRWWVIFVTAEKEQNRIQSNDPPHTA